ncbi:hypothetical protein N7474_010951 [Penicillium riverlandense]|uniref:uncharacterized protein n=1 Tax=Penicillium riverlandense TaxID=1903569 RepID=UPI002548866B|nr:uncharacterized protein N7474_010951 [Penicillium riverlandense]KAJ5805064.1 hypothetical protein N7474_010951 [Penicillium riverlandense]
MTMEMNQQHPQSQFPPGTILLEDRLDSGTRFLRSPVPSADPNDPLNWSPFRKAVNFGLACFYVLFTFVLLDIQSIAYQGYTEELHLSYQTLNDASAANFAGLALGCILFIPLVHKYGRRPIYILSSAVQFAMGIWSAKVQTGGELVAINLIMGLGGALSETITMITIVDLFFVHQHARMNAIFLFMQTLGATGGPISAGYIAVAEGWRWIWWWTAIFLGTNFVAVLLFFEESKFVPTAVDQGLNMTRGDITEGQSKGTIEENENVTEGLKPVSSLVTEYSKKSLTKRLAFVTKTDIPIKRHFYQPLLAFFIFPAVTFTALTYGLLLAWFAIISSAGSYFLLDPPYNFSPANIGLFHLAGFIGATIGAVVGGSGSDWAIVRASQRNCGIFEPEMRLWMSIPGSVFACAGILLFGIGLGEGLPWIILAVGTAIFGFGFIITADIALTYLTDSYPDILGDALVAVVFVRNGISMIIKFVFTPWIDKLGIRDTFVCVGMLSLLAFFMPLPLMFWGKKARSKTAAKYVQFANQQPVRRHP